MINRDPQCVFVANTMGHAAVVAGWLEGQGLPASVMNDHTMGGLAGLSPVFSRNGVSIRGIEVWVLHREHITLARQLLAEHELTLNAELNDQRGPDATLEVVCEDCGKSTTFKGAEIGKIQECRHCGSFVDAFLDSEDWATTAEDDDESGERRAPSNDQIMTEDFRDRGVHKKGDIAPE